MRARKIFKLVIFIAIIMWALTVYMLSAEVADDSTKTSGNTIKLFIRIFSPQITDERLSELVELLQPFIRKLAHFILYALGGFLIYTYTYMCKEKIKYPKILAILVGSFYSVTDEIHQLYVPGRSGEVRDIIIDSMGIIVGVLLLHFVIYINNIYKRRRKHAN